MTLKCSNLSLCGDTYGLIVPIPDGCDSIKNENSTLTLLPTLPAHRLIFFFCP